MCGGGAGTGLQRTAPEPGYGARACVGLERKVSAPGGGAVMASGDSARARWGYPFSDRAGCVPGAWPMPSGEAPDPAQGVRLSRR